MFTPNPEKLLILMLIVALVLGPRRLPKAAGALGRNIRRTKDAAGVEAIRSEVGDIRKALQPASLVGEPTETAAAPAEAAPAAPSGEAGT